MIAPIGKTSPRGAGVFGRGEDGAADFAQCALIEIIEKNHEIRCQSIRFAECVSRAHDAISHRTSVFALHAEEGVLEAIELPIELGGID